MFLVLCRWFSSVFSPIRPFARAARSFRTLPSRAAAQLRSRQCALEVASAALDNVQGNRILTGCSATFRSGTCASIPSTRLLGICAAGAAAGHNIHALIRNHGDLGGAETEMLLGHLDREAP